jgi:hypothetical protein
LHGGASGQFYKRTIARNFLVVGRGAGSKALNSHPTFQPDKPQQNAYLEQFNRKVRLNSYYSIVGKV